MAPSSISIPFTTGSSLCKKRRRMWVLKPGSKTVPKWKCNRISEHNFLARLRSGYKLIGTESRTFPARSPKSIQQRRKHMKSQIPNAQVATTQISVINESTVLTDADVTPVVSALQQQ